MDHVGSSLVEVMAGMSKKTEIKTLSPGPAIHPATEKMRFVP